MKKLSYIVCLFFLLSCNKENGSDCFQTTGSLIRNHVNVVPFSKIQIEDDVNLILKQENEFHVEIETGSNMWNDVRAFVEEETLIIQDNNGCNLIRDYGVTTAYVSVPNLTHIRNASSNDIISNGTLNFPYVELISNSSGNIEDLRKSGDFRLNLVSDELFISANGQSIFYLSGSVKNAEIIFSDEWPRLEGETLSIDSLHILQRSATYMKVLPLEKITGEIRGTGDVILFNVPEIIEVEEFFTGKLIIKD